MIKFMKELWTDNKILFFLAVALGICMIAMFTMLGFVIYSSFNGCPVCGGHEWVTEGVRHAVVGGRAYRVHGGATCTNCGFMF